jgi:chloride channel protein, CIC family
VASSIGQTPRSRQNSRVRFPGRAFGEAAPLDLRIVGRTLLHAGLVGVAAGLVGAAFFASLEIAQRYLLGIAGFEPLRARGEHFTGHGISAPFHPWLLALFPAVGGLASGLLTSGFAPEASGGGGDAAIEAYHHGGLVRRRVIPVKAVAAIVALSSGGSGGREGPTMQIGAGIGAAVARLLPMRRAERRVLLVAGIAAGIAAVFRTPLGAALLATEMLYRDDFEADALVPSIFASVVSYSVVIALFGETTLFGHLPRYGFHPAHLPLYGLAALLVSFAGALFVGLLRKVQRVSARVPVWLRPAIGGLLMGCVGTGLVLWMVREYGQSSGFGVFGGGYGVLQVAITGADWLPPGAALVGLLAAAAALKMLASALTIGTGAAAGDFAPSLVMGGLIGSAFGHGAQLVLHDPSIQPGAFALVGMGTFYGGLAHAPLSALVLVAELAGSYDLLVPMMLAIGIAYVALRKHSLYPAQVPNRAASPRHRAPSLDGELPALRKGRVADVLVKPELGPFDDHAPLATIAEAASGAHRQRVVVIHGSAGPRGLVELEVVLQVPASELAWMRTTDAMVPFASLGIDATWGEVASVLERCGVSQVPIVAGGEVIGWVGDRELRQALIAGSRPASPV